MPLAGMDFANVAFSPADRIHEPHAVRTEQAHRSSAQVIFDGVLKFDTFAPRSRKPAEIRLLN